MSSAAGEVPFEAREFEREAYVEGGLSFTTIEKWDKSQDGDLRVGDAAPDGKVLAPQGSGRLDAGDALVDISSLFWNKEDASSQEEKKSVVLNFGSYS
jgi:hypothetical protein